MASSVIPPTPTHFIQAEQADPAEVMLGPFLKHETEPKTLFWPEARHTNLSGMIHGGVLMTFADFTLCSSVLRGSTDTGCVTVNLNCNFTGNATPGTWVQGEVSISRRTNNLVFATGIVSSDRETIMTFNGIAKRIR